MVTNTQQYETNISNVIITVGQIQNVYKETKMAKILHLNQIVDLLSFDFSKFDY